MKKQEFLRKTIFFKLLFLIHTFYKLIITINIFKDLKYILA